MKISLADDRVELATHQVLRLSDAAATRVVCRRGILWITQDQDRQDVILRAGESFTLDRGGLALVSAIEPSTVCVQAPAGGRIVAGAVAVLRAIGRRFAVPSRHPAIELRCY